MNQTSSKSDDEIYLIDYLLVLWKRKYLILVGTFVCVLAAGVISFLLPKIYSIDMVLRPGIISVGQNGKNIYIDSAQNVKALIEAGTFNNAILDSIAKSTNSPPPKSLELKISLPRESDTLKISYETKDRDLGLNILSLLSKLLIEKYKELVAYYQNEYETKISLKKMEIENHKAEVQAFEQQIVQANKRIDELRSEIQLINNNTMSLIKQRDTFISQSVNSNDVIPAVVYTNTIQQNIGLSNTYKDNISWYMSKKEEDKVALEDAKNGIYKLLEEIRDLEFRKNAIRNIEILQPAATSPYPVKPKKTLNLVLAAAIGLFATVFLAFLMEYINKHKSREHSAGDVQHVA